VTPPGSWHVWQIDSPVDNSRRIWNGRRAMSMLYSWDKRSQLEIRAHRRTEPVQEDLSSTGLEVCGNLLLSDSLNLVFLLSLPSRIRFPGLFLFRNPSQGRCLYKTTQRIWNHGSSVTAREGSSYPRLRGSYDWRDTFFKNKLISWS
jgi:hypothetical protein